MEEREGARGGEGGRTLFQRSWASLTLARARSSVNGGQIPAMLNESRSRGLGEKKEREGATKFASFDNISSEEARKVGF